MQQHRKDVLLATLEISALVVGFLATVPLVVGVSLVALAKATGSIELAMMASPLAIWGVAWTYDKAFEGGKEMVAAVATSKVRNWGSRRAGVLQAVIVNK